MHSPKALEVWGSASPLPQLTRQWQRQPEKHLQFCLCMKMQSLQNHQNDLKINSLRYFIHITSIRVTQLFLETRHLRDAEKGSKVYGACITAPHRSLQEQPQQTLRHTAVRGTLKDLLRNPYAKILPFLKEMGRLGSSNITEHRD